MVLPPFLMLYEVAHEVWGPVRYQPSKSLAEIYRSVYKVRNRLLACKSMNFLQTRSASQERRVSWRVAKSINYIILRQMLFKKEVFRNGW